MKKESKQTKNPKTKIDEDVDDFKHDIVLERSKMREKRILVTLIILVIAVFFGLGIGYYQIFVKPTPLPVEKPADKIESKPEIQNPTPTPETKPAEPAPAATTPAPTPAAPTTTDYTVQSGDTWSSIANSNGLSSKELMNYNNATSEDLQIGQKIKIPK